MDKTELQNKFRGCFLGLACGDAIGFPLKGFNSKEDILAVTNGLGVTGVPDPCLYTDDTQMSLCIAEALIEADDNNMNASAKHMDLFMKALTKQFIDWHKSQDIPEERRSPGSTCLWACKHLSEGIHWEKSGIKDSIGCGSAMRSAPIGLFYDKVEKVVDFSINSSKITHLHELALCGSVATSLLTFFALNEEPVGSWASSLVKIISFNNEFKNIIKTAAKKAAEREHPDNVLCAKCLGEGYSSPEVVASALYCCMMNPNSYKDAVLMAANTIGDSDSIACITGAWMGTKVGFDGIPYEWIDKIENNDKLISIADRLLEKKLESFPTTG